MQESQIELTAQESTSPRALRWGRYAVWAGVLALLVILALGLNRSQSGPVGVGQRAPDFTLTTFDGDEIRLADLEGQVVVVNFWASWCKPCEQEAADLQAAWEQYGPSGKVMFLGVDYVDTDSAARAYLDRFAITYPNGPDLGTRISQSYRILGVPETFFIDQNGVTVHFQKGPFTSLSQIQAVIDPLLPQE